MYIHSPGIDEPIIMSGSSSTYYYHFDGLGSLVSAERLGRSRSGGPD